MATSPLCSPTQLKEDFRDEFLTCVICAEPFDSNNHKAKYLPCLHTFCKSCLQRHAGKRPKFNCPNCRESIPLPGGTVDNLPNNFIVENLKGYQDIFNFDVGLPCGNCDDANPAVSFCQICGSFQCQRCTDNHQVMRSLRHHKLVTIDELQEKKHNPLMLQQQNCEKHPTLPLTLYCKEPGCKVRSCASCGLAYHRTHDLIDLSTASDKIISDIQLSSGKVKVRNQDLITMRLAVQAMQKSLIDDLNSKQELMKESVQELHNEIDRRYSNAVSHLQNLYQIEMNRLTTNVEAIDFLSAQMISARDFAKKACATNNHTELLTSQSHILDRLNELENAELPEMPLQSKFGFSKKHDAAIESVKKSLQHLCDVETLWIITSVRHAADESTEV
ncbi:E3 ubiquitin-protein ligase TRIM56-like [Amphiura filiformis]|uniref:E3 ubiquitin-protein ligase TRIM56-like n=1 Tax=Amphiura filiformis TaxID=82378 RepID=UPI003B210347